MNLLTAYARQIPRSVLVAVAAAVGLLLIIRYRLMHFDAATEAALAKFPEANRAKFRALLERIRSKGWTPIVTSGVRTVAQQQYLHDHHIGGAPAPAPNDVHINGRAMDLNFEKDGFQLSTHRSRAEWVASGIPAIMLDMGFRWGGQFRAVDVVHVDLGLA